MPLGAGNAALDPSTRPGRQAPGEAGPDSQLQRYVPSAAPVRVRASKPSRPNPGTPDEAAMTTKALPSNAPRKATITVVDKAQRPKPLRAKQGAQLGKAGTPGSRPGQRYE
jgi:hypothetical protein